MAESIPKVGELTMYPVLPERPGLFFRLLAGNFIQAEPYEESDEFSLRWSTDQAVRTLLGHMATLLGESGDNNAITDEEREKLDRLAAEVESAQDACYLTDEKVGFVWEPPNRKMVDDTIEHAVVIIQCSAIDERQKLERIIGATGTPQVVEACGNVLDAFGPYIPSLQRA